MKLFGTAEPDNQNLGARTGECQFFGGARSSEIEIVTLTGGGEHREIFTAHNAVCAGLLEFVRATITHARPDAEHKISMV